jgi:MarR-like DNA-binding transcriptional regulator SgrR of sgrS sRNA
MEFAALTLMILGADSATGIWKGSAKALAAIYGFTMRTARKALESLHARGYIKRFPTRGRHGNYPILIHHYECSHGVNEGRRLNAGKTVNWRAPVYESCDEHANDRVNDHVQDHGHERPSTQEGKEERERKHPAVSPEAARLCEHLKRRILQNNVNARIRDSSWARQADLTLRIDGRDPEEAHRLMDWCQSDPFWHTNILSMAKFRVQYDQLLLKMRSTSRNRQSSKPTPNADAWDDRMPKLVSPKQAVTQ